MKVYSPKDRIRVQAQGSEIAFILSPLTARQKADIMGTIGMASGEVVQDRWKMVSLAVKHSLKGIEGVEDSEGNPVKLQVGPDGSLTDESLDIVMNLPSDSALAFTSALQFATRGAANSILNPETGEPLPDVEVRQLPKA